MIGKRMTTKGCMRKNTLTYRSFKKGVGPPGPSASLARAHDSHLTGNKLVGLLSSENKNAKIKIERTDLVDALAQNS